MPVVGEIRPYVELGQVPAAHERRNKPPRLMGQPEHQVDSEQKQKARNPGIVVKRTLNLFCFVRRRSRRQGVPYANLRGLKRKFIANGTRSEAKGA